MASLNKKTFEYRMSKKVAELTQVVHMLFTRNHEKEVEIEALKDAYEYEIEVITSEARSKIKILEEDLEKHKNAEEKERLISENEELKLHIEKINFEVEELQNDLNNERSEHHKTQKLFQNAQDTVDSLKGHFNDKALISSELDEKQRELEKKTAENLELQKQLEHTKKDSKSAEEYEKLITNLQKETSDLKNSLIDTLRLKDQMTYQNKQLEQDIVKLKEELMKGRIQSSKSHLNANDITDKNRDVLVSLGILYKLYKKCLITKF